MELGADCHTAVVCDTHGGDDDVEARAACGCVHGQTPLELVEKHDESLLAEHIRRRLFHGRGCRGTPVKERAAKVGVRLPPTPEGASKVQLRKHQLEGVPTKGRDRRGTGRRRPDEAKAPPFVACSHTGEVSKEDRYKKLVLFKNSILKLRKKTYTKKELGRGHSLAGS